MLQKITKNGDTSTDYAKVIITDKFGNVKKISASSGAVWGFITGTLIAQTDLISYLTTTYFPIPTGTISQYIDGTGALQTFPTITNGTVTSVAALTLGTTGTDLSSTVANPTTTPVITLNVPTASATNRGALSSTDWSIFNNKQTDLFEFNTKQGFNFFEDFLGSPANNSYNSYGIGTATIGTGAVCIPNTTYPNRTNQQGVLQMGTGTTATGILAIRVGDNNNPAHYLGNGIYTIQSFVNIETLSTLTERFFAIIGSTTGANFAITNGIFFIYDEGIGTYGAASPNFKCITSSGLVRTATITSIPVVASQWYVLKIVNANATSVEFFIDGVSVATHTTNIPTIITPRVAMQKTIGITNRNMFCDYLAVKQIYTTPRV